jgi:hypothetical protein
MLPLEGSITSCPMLSLEGSGESERSPLLLLPLKCGLGFRGKGKEKKNGEKKEGERAYIFSKRREKEHILICHQLLDLTDTSLSTSISRSFSSSISQMLLNLTDTCCDNTHLPAS